MAGMRRAVRLYYLPSGSPSRQGALPGYAVCPCQRPATDCRRGSKRHPEDAPAWADLNHQSLPAEPTIRRRIHATEEHLGGPQIGGSRPLAVPAALSIAPRGYRLSLARTLRVNRLEQPCALPLRDNSNQLAARRTR